MVTSNGLIEQAAAQAGLNNFGDDWFRGPLEAWVQDLEGAHLSERGRAFLTRLAVNDLARRAQILECLKQNPEIEEVAIPPILYITGHERSGTTFLHNLLSQHLGARYLSRWELMMPTPPPEPGSLMDDPRRAQVQKSVDALKGSDLESMHWVDAHDPEECVWGFMDCTALLGQAPVMIMPTWRAWLADNDLTPTFLNYRKIIQTLTWKNPVPEAGFLVLKAPQITRDLATFAAAMPEAHFVFSHRDPYRVLTSTLNLVDIVNSSFLQDKEYIARQEMQEGVVHKMCQAKLEAMVAFDISCRARVINVDYGDLVARPVQEVVRIFAKTKCGDDPELETSVTDFIESQKEGRRAKPRVDLSSYGYDQGEVLAANVTARYMEHFGLAAEMTRRTGT